MIEEKDLAPETICGTVLATKAAFLRGDQPNEDQVRACYMANKSEAIFSWLVAISHALLHVGKYSGRSEHECHNSAMLIATQANEFMKSLPAPRVG